MFDAIKGKLQSVQSDITEGFRHLRKKRPLSQRRLSSTVSFHLEFINADAGAELLQGYTEAWRCINQTTAESAAKCREVDAGLQSVVGVADRKANDLLQLQKELLTLSAVSEEVSTLITETAKLEGLCEEVESALAYLDVLCNTEDSQSIKLEQRFQLALYRERKVADLSEAKTHMALDFMRENETLDRRRRQQQEDKLQILQSAMEKDINTFKTSGVIANSLFAIADDRRMTRSVSAEETDLARLASYAPIFGSDEQHALEEFLSNVKWEDSGIVGDSASRGETDAVDQDSNGNNQR